MEIKHSVESEFVTSLLDSVIIKHLVPDNYTLIKDAIVLSKCVNLHPVSLKLADCSGSKDRIQSFISGNEKFEEIKQKTISECSEQLIKYHSATFNKHNDKSSFFNHNIAKNIEQNFNNCFREANSGLI